jgi:hypothetical protein
LFDAKSFGQDQSPKVAARVPHFAAGHTVSPSRSNTDFPAGRLDPGLNDFQKRLNRALPEDKELPRWDLVKKRVSQKQKRIQVEVVKNRNRSQGGRTRQARIMKYHVSRRFSIFL